MSKPVLAALLVFVGLVPERAAADLAPSVPNGRREVVLTSSDPNVVWVAYPVRHGAGVPVLSAERVVPGTALDVGRTTARLYAFAAADLSDDGTGLRGAPTAFGVGEVAGSITLADFFDGATVPSAPLPAPGIDALFGEYALVRDECSVEVVDGALVLRLLRTHFERPGAAPETIEASATGERVYPAAPPPPPAPAPAPAPAPTPAAEPEESGGMCSVGRGGSSTPAALSVLVGLALALRRSKRAR